MDRRIFLKSVALTAGGLAVPALLSACGEEEGAQAIPEGEPELSVIVASYETLTGEGRRIPFGVRTIDNTEVSDAEIEAYLRDLRSGDVVAGPTPATYRHNEDIGLGLYTVHFDVPRPGTFELVAVQLGDEQRYGTAAINVVTPSDSALAAPGKAAVVTATPTLAQPLGYDLADPDDDSPVAAICTLDPPCGMHDVSLDTALAEGKPVVLLFATPEFCTSAMCGPAVDNVEAVRTAQDWGETVWIHCEIFTDAEQTLGEPVKQWALPSEPWLFTIGADGQIVDRLDGPMPREFVEELVSDLSPG